MKKLRVALSDAAIADILQQSDWYETQANRNLAKRWEEAVTGTLLGIVRNPGAGAPCRFTAAELRGLSARPLDSFAYGRGYQRGLPEFLILPRFPVLGSEGQVMTVSLWILRTVRTKAVRDQRQAAEANSRRVKDCVAHGRRHRHDRRFTGPGGRNVLAIK